MGHRGPYGSRSSAGMRYRCLFQSKQWGDACPWPPPPPAALLISFPAQGTPHQLLMSFSPWYPEHQPPNPDDETFPKGYQVSSGPKSPKAPKPFGQPGHVVLDSFVGVVPFWARHLSEDVCLHPRGQVGQDWLWEGSISNHCSFWSTLPARAASLWVFMSLQAPALMNFKATRNAGTILVSSASGITRMAWF